MGIKNIIGELQVNGSPVVTEESIKDLDIGSSGFSGSYNDLTDVPEAFTPAEHDHDDDYIEISEKGTANGVATLDENGRVSTSQLPSYVDDVLEYSAKSAFPATGEAGKIYVDITDNKTYRWSGSAYVEISASLALGETSSTAYAGDKGKVAYTHSQTTSGNPHGVNKSEVGLGNVDNVKQYSVSNPPPYPVTKVNNKTGDVILSASDVGADASGTASSAVTAHNTNTSAHADIREQINQLSSEIADLPNNELLVQNVAQKVPYVKVAEPPVFVDSVDEMTDISKMYVLKSDGMFYSYKAHTTTTPGGTVANFTNKVPTSIDENGKTFNDTGYMANARLSSNGTVKEGQDYSNLFGYIPAKGGDTIRFKSVSKNGADVIWYTTEQNANYICAYDANFNHLYTANSQGGYQTSSLVDSMSLEGSVSVIKLKNVANIAYIRMSVFYGYSLNDIVAESAIITVNEEITYTTTEEGTTTTYSWESTGISYNQPADYEHRVIAMENELEVLLNGTF